jgi:hypothetical protein
MTQLTQRLSQKKDFVAGHPKMAKLEEVVLDHFRSFPESLCIESL